MNVWNRALIDEFSHWVERFVADPDILGAVIVSGKTNAFHAGADIDLLLEGDEGPTDPLDKVIARLSSSLRALETGGQHAADLLRGKSAAKPVAVAIEGLALGGGLELALACHYRVASDGPGVGLGLPEIQFGLLPGAGGMQRLMRLSGLKVAAELCLDGRQISAQQALKYGLVNEVVSAGTAGEAARRCQSKHPGGAAVGPRRIPDSRWRRGVRHQSGVVLHRRERQATGGRQSTPAGGAGDPVMSLSRHGPEPRRSPFGCAPRPRCR